jgi:virginiamycin B lyase
MCSRGSLWLALLLLIGAAVGGTLLTRGQVNGAPNHQTPPLPEGAGKATVQTACAGCHSLTQVTNAGHNRAEWDTILHMMINAGAPVPADQYDTVLNYLAAKFPPKPRPQAKILSGPVRVTIKEWVVPTAGSRPHDPMYAPDGSVWYTGQMANVLGRFDPKTETFKEYRLPPHSGPHGLLADKDGNVWYTANFGGYIGKLNPRTGAVARYPLPDPNARDPHTPILDGPDRMFFTVQGANMVGRLNMTSGEITLARSPTPRSNPYGMVVDSKGVPYFAEFGANKIASIDPKTMQIHEYVLPHDGSRPRRVAITPDDAIYYTDYSRGYLGRFDTRTGAITEWPSPGGPSSQPYGITFVNGIVWYSESNTKPNTIVRFDPRTERFQTWAIPSGGGVVRNMVHTPDGSALWVACSGMNRIGRVQIKRPTALPRH